MKKLIYIFLLMLLASFVFTGCGETGTADSMEESTGLDTASVLPVQESSYDSVSKVMIPPKYPFEEACSEGLIDENSRRLTVDDLLEIITSVNSGSELINAVDTIQPYCDVIDFGKYNLKRFIYYPNINDKSEQIIINTINKQAQMYSVVYQSNGERKLAGLFFEKFYPKNEAEKLMQKLNKEDLLYEFIYN